MGMDQIVFTLEDRCGDGLKKPGHGKGTRGRLVRHIVILKIVEQDPQFGAVGGKDSKPVPVRVEILVDIPQEGSDATHGPSYHDENPVSPV